MNVAPVAGKNATTKSSSIIDLDAFADLLGASTITEQTDIGCALVYKAAHPEHGSIILINTTGADSLVMFM